MKPPDETSARRSRRRPGAAEVSHAVFDRTLPYRHLRNPFTPMKVFSDDQVAAMHEAALSMLETQGMKVLSADARVRYAKAGATVDETSQMVRLDRGLVTAALSTTPKELTLHAVDPQRHVPLSNGCVAFAPTSGPPNIMDTARGRRAGTFEDFCNLIKLCQSFEVIHVLGGATEPQDLPVQFRHLHVTRAQLMLCEKIPFIFSRGHGQVADNFELIRLAHGISPEEFRSRPYVYTIINTNSPLQLDVPMADGIIDFAIAGQVLIITPFTLAGAMAPVTVAGALTLAHAECLAGLTLAQIVRPGGSHRVRQLHLERRPEIRITRFRHARIREGGVRRGPDGAVPGIAVAILERDGLEHPGRPVRLRICRYGSGRAVRRLQFRAARGGAGWRAGSPPRTKNSFWTSRSCRCSPRCSSLWEGGAADIALEAVAEVGPGGRFLRLRAHHGTLSECLLRAARIRLAQFRQLVGGRRQDGHRASQRHLAGHAGKLCRTKT